MGNLNTSRNIIIHIEYLLKFNIQLIKIILLPKKKNNIKGKNKELIEPLMCQTADGNLININCTGMS